MSRLGGYGVFHNKTCLNKDDIDVIFKWCKHIEMYHEELIAYPIHETENYGRKRVWYGHIKIIVCNVDHVFNKNKEYNFGGEDSCLMSDDSYFSFTDGLRMGHSIGHTEGYNEAIRDIKEEEE